MKYDILNNFKYDSENYEKIELFNSFFREDLENLDWSYKYPNLLLNNSIIHDSESEYLLNSMGYRSHEFKKENIDVLITGCSISYGMGVSENKFWVPMLEKEFDLKIANLSIVGASSYRLCNDLMLYCSIYGKPKTIIALLPDFFRVEFVVNKSYHNSSHVKKPYDVYATKILLNYQKDQLEKYSKIPFELEKGISPDVGVYYNLNAIKQLEMFCQNSNINLLWATWNKETQHICDEIQKRSKWFKNYMPNFQENVGDWWNTTQPNCCNNHEFRNEKAWTIGTDNPAAGRKHPGIHFHIHTFNFIKQYFIEMMKE